MLIKEVDQIEYEINVGKKLGGQKKNWKEYFLIHMIFTQFPGALGKPAVQLSETLAQNRHCAAELYYTILFASYCIIATEAI